MYGLAENTFHEMISSDDKIMAAEAGDTILMDKLAMIYLNVDEDTTSNPEKPYIGIRSLQMREYPSTYII